MKCSLFLTVLLATFVLASRAQSAEEEGGLRPMDTRTRCIVLFREALVHLHGQRVDQVLHIVADGLGENEFLTFPAEAIKTMSSAEEKQFLNEFRGHDAAFTAFDRITFSDVITKTQRATLKRAKGEPGEPAKVYVIKVHIPGLPQEQFRELRFIEAGEKLFWVPFGW